jgi:hypothetical protein
MNAGAAEFAFKKAFCSDKLIKRNANFVASSVEESENALKYFM